MKMYHWNSEALCAYTAGDIIVIAKSIEEARSKVINYAKQNNYDINLDTLKNDINEEPSEETVIFIYGSN